MRSDTLDPFTLLCLQWLCVVGRFLGLLSARPLLSVAGWRTGVCFCSLPMSGNYNYNNGDVNNVGNNGNWWSATSGSQSAYAHNLEFNAGNLNPQNDNFRGNGLTVRCVQASR